MAEVPPHKLDQLPPEMLEFTLLKTSGALAPRLGRIAVAGRKTILTPAFIGNTSRGIIPHVSQDNFRRTDSINGVYVPLEDCMPSGRDSNHVFVWLTARSCGETPPADTAHLRI